MDMIRRSFSFLAALFGIALFSPVMIPVALLILIDDGGPIFFKQVRVGQLQKLFLIYKFRTMRQGRVTRAGRWLRKTGLDELPQFFNVLRGEMLIVGPRPLTQDDIQRLDWNTHSYASRWSIPPGLTGLAQIFSGDSASVSWLFDQLYLKKQSLIFDFQIILISFGMNVFGKSRIRNLLRPYKDHLINEKEILS